MFMNEVEIEFLASRSYDSSNVLAGVKLLHALMQAVNAQSDGWAHWSPPWRSCQKLYELLKEAGTAGFITDAELRQAVAPIRAMVTRQSKLQKKYGNTFEFDVDAALARNGKIMSLQPGTVEDLLHHLSDLPPGTKVILAKDAEGNDFKQLDEVSLESPDPAKFGDDVIILWPRHD